MSAERFQLAIAGEGRGVAVADLNRNGWPDLVVTCGNDGAMALVNRGNPGSHSFSVKLRGDRGNPDAVGARSPPPSRRRRPATDL